MVGFPLGATTGASKTFEAEEAVRAGAREIDMVLNVGALKAGDATKAFSYATPGIRGEFRDPANFIAMVRTMYSALLTARYAEFLEGAVIGGTVIQPLRLVDTDNTVRVALYIMEQQGNGTWRIGGCRIAPSTVQAA